jgi:hypothetical protein
VLEIMFITPSHFLLMNWSGSLNSSQSGYGHGPGSSAARFLESTRCLLKLVARFLWRFCES